MSATDALTDLRMAAERVDEEQRVADAQHVGRTVLRRDDAADSGHLRNEGETTMSDNQPMNGAAPVGPPQLRPAQNVQPGRYDMEARLQRMPDGQHIILLHVEHMTGATFLFLEIGPAEQLAKQLQMMARQSRGEPAEGLVIARDVPPQMPTQGRGRRPPFGT